MQKQLKINQANILYTIRDLTSSWLLIVILMLASSINAWANTGKGAKNVNRPGSLLSTVTTDPSSLFFNAIQLHPSDAKEVRIVVSGVSATAQTTITAPDFYEILITSTTRGKTFTFTGNASVILPVRFAGSPDPGNFSGQITITGAEISTKTVSLATANSRNPSFFPSALNFSTINDGKPSLPLEIDITISAISPSTQTFVRAPDFYELLTSPTGEVGSTFIFTGSGLFKIFVRFKGSVNPGSFSGQILAEGDGIISQNVPVKTVVLATPTPTANPTSLSGFTAIEGGSASVVQSFDLSVKGLPAQGKPFVTVTAPKGYSVGLSANASSFVNAFVVFSGNGNISTKVFARLNSTNPVGPVNGNVSITGSQIKPKNVPVTGIITARPVPALSVDKASLTGFTTTTNKASVAQSYKLQAINLDAGIVATVKAPAGYEVSLTNVTNSIFSGQLTVTQVAGAINATIFVRLKSQAAAVSVTGTIQNLVAGLSKNVALSGIVVLPPALSVNPLSLAGFLAVKNQASAAKTYTITASNLPAGLSVAVTAPVNYELRLQGSGLFDSVLTVTQNGAGSINRIIEVRLKATSTTGTITGAIKNTAAGLVRNINVTGTVAAPTLATSASSLTFTAIKNQASAAKAYKVIATNLAAGITATVTPSSAYEVSKDSIVFANSLALSQNVTNGINTNVFVRLKATVTTGTITGSIQHAVAGLSKQVSLNTVVAAPTLSVNPISLSGFTAPINQPSVAKTYNLVASNLAGGITATVTAPAGYEISVQGTNVFSTSLNLTQTTNGVISRILLVRLKAQATGGTFTGSITNSVAGLSKTVAVSGIITTPISARADIFTRLQEPGNSLPDDKGLFVRAFPNPVTDQFTVEFSTEPNQPVQILLSDIQGKLLLKKVLISVKGIRQIRLSLAGQASGPYFVQVISGKKSKTIPVLKQ